MNKEKLSRLLDSVYEFEGLIHLALAREDCPESLPSLIKMKAEALTKRASEIIGVENTDTDMEYNDVSHGKIDGQKNAFESYLIGGEGDPECAGSDNSADGLNPGTDAVEGAVVAETEIPGDEIREIIPDDKPQSRTVEPRGRLVFTINDRYRFKRDLFCNSDADFNTTLALVASMDGYEEAEDYFLGELQWNPQREEVISFLEILKNYFK